MKKPPKIVDCILESFCNPHLLEEVQGDLHELYGKWLDRYGSKKANWWYFIQTVKFFRPFAIKKLNFLIPQNNGNAAQVLKNLSGIKLFKRFAWHKGLIVFQFSISLIFVICFLVIYQQSRFEATADYGFDKENILTITLQGADYKLLRTKIIVHTNLENTWKQSGAQQPLTYFNYRIGCNFLTNHQGCIIKSC